jgi:L-ascorbate metabolism protein UlaG (beta-lactamase superfamily)
LRFIVADTGVQQVADIETHKIAYQGAPKVKFFANACVAIYTSEFNLLCDPWLVDGAFDGSWYHFPPLKTKPEDLNDYTHIYISHIHPDHFDSKPSGDFPRNLQ